jgi:hypothetical protein
MMAMQRLELSNLNGTPTEFASLWKNCPRLQCLKISDNPALSSLTAEHFRVLSDSSVCPQLHTLHIRRVQNGTAMKQVHRIIRRCNSLTDLALERCGSLVDATFLSTHCRPLKSLSLVHTTVPKPSLFEAVAARHARTLITLTMEALSSVETLQLLQAAPRLKMLGAAIADAQKLQPHLHLYPHLTIDTGK